MSETRTYYYARVSTKKQSLDRQLEAFHQLGAEEKYIFADKQSGKNLERTNYQILRNNILRSGDTLVIKSLDRLSRNKLDIKSELEYYKQNGIRVKVIDMPTTMIDLEGQEWIIEMVNNIIIEVLSAVAEQERQETRKRQAEGIAAARKRGQHLGRQEIDFPPNWFETKLISKLIEARESKGLSQRELAEISGIKQPAIARLENMRSTPQIDTLFRLLAPLGYTLSIVPIEIK